MKHQSEPWIDLLNRHLTWYPRMELRDVYKLVYQGVMGSEHQISSPQGFTNYLVEEFEPLRPDPTGRLLEPIRPEHSLFRINLCPYKALHQPVDLLVPALLETARSSKGELGVFKATWIGFIQACEQGQVSIFEGGEIHEFTAWVDGLGFPAVHHSETYSLSYTPAYRLISERLAAQFGLSDYY